MGFLNPRCLPAWDAEQHFDMVVHVAAGLASKPDRKKTFRPRDGQRFENIR